MNRFRRIPLHNMKLPPGTLPVTSSRDNECRFTVIDYSSKSAEVREYSDIADCYSYLKSSTVSWINIEGAADSSIITSIGEQLSLHPLVMEDIMNPHHHPKFEEFDNYLFVIAKMIRFDRESLQLSQEQVSMILGKNYVLTFQESHGDIFDSIRGRIKNGTGRIRRLKADYLFCSLLDMIIDNYYPILEDLDEVIEEMDVEIHSHSNGMPSELYTCQKQVSFLHRSVWPVRDILKDILRSENKLIDQKTIFFFKDINDHIIQILDLVGSFRDNVNALMELSVALNGDRLNHVMKFLTLVSTIFIPLSFIAGVYGMNFRNMPELDTEYGYFIVLGVMLSVFIGMIILFKKRKWF